MIGCLVCFQQVLTESRLIDERINYRVIDTAFCSLRIYTGCPENPYKYTKAY